MAKINDTGALGKRLMEDAVIELDTRAITRAAFGPFRWRLRLGRQLLWVAAKLLRCQINIVVPEV